MLHFFLTSGSQKPKSQYMLIIRTVLHEWCTVSRTCEVLHHYEVGDEMWFERIPQHKPMTGQSEMEFQQSGHRTCLWNVTSNMYVCACVCVININSSLLHHLHLKHWCWHWKRPPTSYVIPVKITPGLRTYSSYSNNHVQTKMLHFICTRVLLRALFKSMFNITVSSNYDIT